MGVVVIFMCSHLKIAALAHRLMNYGSILNTSLPGPQKVSPSNKVLGELIHKCKQMLSLQIQITARWASLSPSHTDPFWCAESLLCEGFVCYISIAVKFADAIFWTMHGSEQELWALRCKSVLLSLWSNMSFFSHSFNSIIQYYNITIWI